MLALHLDNFLFILLVAGIGLLRLLAKKAGGSIDDDSAPGPERETPPPLPRPAEQTDEESIRKFLEALGQPTSSKPPSPVRPRPVLPGVTEFPREKGKAAQVVPRRSLLNPLPPLMTVPPSESSRRVIRPRPVAFPAVPEPTATPDLPATPPPLPMVAVEAYKVAGTVPASGMLKPFGGPDDLKRAIILREVLGPPRALQPLNFMESA